MGAGMDSQEEHQPEREGGWLAPEADLASGAAKYPLTQGTQLTPPVTPISTPKKRHLTLIIPAVIVVFVGAVLGALLVVRSVPSWQSSAHTQNRQALSGNSKSVDTLNTASGDVQSAITNEENNQSDVDSSLDDASQQITIPTE